MKRLDLDFLRRPRGSRWASRILVAAALAVAGDMAYTYARLERDVKAHEAVLAREKPRRAAAPSVSPDELAVARETVDRLSLPWAKLFSALEGAANDRVALLAIEPDPKSGTVKISGDSKDYLAALTYVLDLSKTPTLSNVQLVRHEVKANDPQNPVAFQISAAWNEVKR